MVECGYIDDTWSGDNSFSIYKPSLNYLNFFIVIMVSLRPRKERDDESDIAEATVRGS